MKLTPTEARVISQRNRSRLILDTHASKVASTDRRKLRRWVNRVINFTRYEVKAKGLLTSNIDTHRAQMKKFRHSLPRGFS